MNVSNLLVFLLIFYLDRCMYCRKCTNCNSELLFKTCKDCNSRYHEDCLLKKFILSEIGVIENNFCIKCNSKVFGKMNQKKKQSKSGKSTKKKLSPVVLKKEPKSYINVNRVFTSNHLIEDNQFHMNLRKNISLRNYKSNPNVNHSYKGYFNIKNQYNSLEHSELEDSDTEEDSDIDIILEEKKDETFVLKERRKKEKKKKKKKTKKKASESQITKKRMIFKLTNSFPMTENEKILYYSLLDCPIDSITIDVFENVLEFQLFDSNSLNLLQTVSNKIMNNQELNVKEKELVMKTNFSQKAENLSENSKIFLFSMKGKYLVNLLDKERTEMIENHTLDDQSFSGKKLEDCTFKQYFGKTSSYSIFKKTTLRSQKDEYLTMIKLFKLSINISNAVKEDLELGNVETVEPTDFFVHKYLNLQGYSLLAKRIRTLLLKKRISQE